MPRSATPPKLTLRQLNRATLARQMLLARERVTALAAVERLVALQAQWPSPPFFGLWSRVHGFERAQLTTLCEQRKLVRATFLRGTLHVASAKDFLALRATLQPVLDDAMNAILARLGAALDVPPLTALAREALADGPRRFEELRERLLKARPKDNERAMGYAVRMSLPLVQVPAADEAWAFPADAQFAPAETWLGKPLGRDSTAQREALVLRYLAGYGPASVADLQSWCGLQGLRATVEGLRPSLCTFHDPGGRELFDLEDAPRPDENVPAPVRFVPGYDNLITTRADERFVARARRPRVFLSALRIAPTVLVDGFAAGTWKIARKKATATLAVEPFAAAPARVRRELETEGQALLRFAEPDAAHFDVQIAR